MKSTAYCRRRLISLEDKLERLTASHQPAPEMVMEILRLEGRVAELRNILEQELPVKSNHAHSECGNSA